MGDYDCCRPYPPVNFIASDNWQPYNRLIPANEVNEWISRQILSDSGSIHNPDHEHLLEADLCFMWASGSFVKKGRYVLGQAEQVMFRAGGWQKARMEQQMYEWFGRIPKFIITLAADYCSQCSDLEFCALVEHELYHIAQATDDFDAPKSKRYRAALLTLLSNTGRFSAVEKIVICLFLLMSLVGCSTTRTVYVPA
ncbi:putative metallopeptidase [Enterobacter soli]|uniref:putative metallopeptidase n=1 Tax=Enterobacter soli TaxID=885040 RepID=UPI00373281CA